MHTQQLNVGGQGTHPHAIARVGVGVEGEEAAIKHYKAAHKGVEGQRRSWAESAGTIEWQRGLPPPVDSGAHWMQPADTA